MSKSLLQPLKISQNQRYLVHADDTPFFWLADTAWELFHRLNREEAELYLRSRAKLQFNVIQAVALAEKEGLTLPNPYGRLPLKKNAQGQFDPAMPDIEGTYSYWEHVDFIVELAASLGQYIALLPTWGDKYNQMWGGGPEIFTAESAEEYGRWLGMRYRNHTNIIWVLGGDRPLNEYHHFAINRALAAGLKAGDGGNHLMTFHPSGAKSSSLHVHNEDWLDFNMIQSGHSNNVQNNYTYVESDYKRLPAKPTLDAEPCYEDHPRGFNIENGFFDEVDVRTAAYYAVFAGGFGHTYGHHSIWSMTTEPENYFIMHWKQAIDRPGAAHMQHLRKLMEAYPAEERIPAPSLIEDNYKGANYMAACRGAAYAMIYSPNGLRMSINMGILSGSEVKAQWFDPRTGSVQSAGSYANEGTQRFTPPSAGRGNDWVLLLTSNK